MQITELTQSAIAQTLLLAAPALLTAIAIGIAIGIIQSLMQVQDHALAFVPKLVGVLVVVWLFLPWMVDSMAEFSRHSIEQIPEIVQDP